MYLGIQDITPIILAWAEVKEDFMLYDTEYLKKYFMSAVHRQIQRCSLDSPQKISIIIIIIGSFGD
jgi:hypothetical protein